VLASILASSTVLFLALLLRRRGDPRAVARHLADLERVKRNARRMPPLEEELVLPTMSANVASERSSSADT
jgi:hypothetical protein